MSKRPTLDEQIVTHRSFKDRSRKKILTHILKSWTPPNGTTLNLYEFRVYFTDRDGIDKPTQAGITVSVNRLRDIHEGITKSLKKAQELGLLDDDEAGS